MLRSKASLVLWSLIGAVFSAVSVGHGQALDDLSFEQKLQRARAGDTIFQVALGRAYESGTDITLNEAEAANWYRKAADQGNIEAMYRLARIFSRGAPEVDKDSESAAKLYAAAARQGHVEAENWLGYCYQHGLGVQQSDASAVEWYSKAAKSGLAGAESNLGLMYLAGKGVGTDVNKAVELFGQAAKQKDAWGLNNLGGLYEMGWGVGRDEQKALDYYRQAAEMGSEAASQNLERLSSTLVAVNSTTKADFRSMPHLDDQAASVIERTSARPRKAKTEARRVGKLQTKPVRSQRAAAKKTNPQSQKQACQPSFFERLFANGNCD